MARVGLDPEGLHHVAGVDPDGAGQRARAVAGARLDRVVRVGAGQLVGHRRADRLAHHLAAQRDPLPGRGGDPPARADALAEAALDALVGDGLDGRWRS